LTVGGEQLSSIWFKGGLQAMWPAGDVACRRCGLQAMWPAGEWDLQALEPHPMRGKRAMRFLGELLLTNDSTTGTAYFTEFEPRQGVRAVVSVQVLANAEVESLTAQLQTKDVKDPVSSATSVGSAQGISLTNDVTSYNTGQTIDGTGSDGIKELVRLKMTVKAKTTATSLPAWVRVRVLGITWSPS
jgi:hypothetical protein